ncbi:hypothetical protein [Pseudomonas sp. S2_F03]
MSKIILRLGDERYMRLIAGAEPLVARFGSLSRSLLEILHISSETDYLTIEPGMLPGMNPGVHEKVFGSFHKNTVARPQYQEQPQ